LCFLNWLQVGDIEKFYPGTVAGIREWIPSNSLSNLMYSGIRTLYFFLFFWFFLSILHIIQLTPHIFLLQVDDIEKFYPGTVAGIREWFRWYKTPDGKPINGFGHGEKALGAKEAVHVGR